MGQLRFDPRFAESGSSDVAFFRQYEQLGHRIVFSGKAHFTETYNGSRTRNTWHLLRPIRNSQLVLEGERGDVKRMVPQVTKFTEDAWAESLRLVASVLWPLRLPSDVKPVLLNLAAVVGGLAHLLGVRYYAYSRRRALEWFPPFSPANPLTPSASLPGNTGSLRFGRMAPAKSPSKQRESIISNQRNCNSPDHHESLPLPDASRA